MRPRSITIVPHSSPDWSDSVPLFLLSASICRMSVRAKSLKSPLNSMWASSFRNYACNELPQFGLGDRLRQIAIGPHAHPELDVLFRTLSTDYNYRQVLSIQFRPHPADKLETVHVRHPDVGQDQVEFSVPDLVKRVLPVNRLRDVGFLNAVQPGQAHAEQLPECG